MGKQITLRFFHLLAMLLVAGVLGYAFATYKVNLSWKQYKPIVNIKEKNPPAGQDLNMSLFFEVLDKVSRDYYDKSKIDSKKVLYGAISGMLQSLDDPYTSFFPPKQNEEFKTQLSGEFSGIGAELGIKDGKIIVVSPLDESPAEKGGIKAGDTILKVDDKETVGWTLPQAVERIRGPRGTTVTLLVLHGNENAPVEVKIVRDTIVIKSATGEIKSVDCHDNKCEVKKNCKDCAHVAYMRLSQFGDKTNTEWVALVNKLYPDLQKDRNFRGIVLDLRNNPGGYLQDAVFIASEFLRSGVVVMQEDGTGARTSLSVSRRGLLLDYPLVVLINKGSASASEIVSGALRDYNRARLVGEKSFGKGTIQQPVDVDDGASVHISVAKWLTPNGTWVDRKGLEPDVKVDLDATAAAKLKKGDIDNQLERAILELVR